MNEATDLLLLSVAAAAKEGKYFDIYQAIGRMTLQVVGTTAFGYVLIYPSSSQRVTALGTSPAPSVAHTFISSSVSGRTCAC